MANNNDNKIKTLLQAIENKKKAMGTKPKATWETNGIIDGQNINTINSIDKCVILASAIISKKNALIEACNYLNVEKDISSMIEAENSLTDLKLRVEIIKWDLEKKKLQIMEKKLKDLRSEDAKTEDALSDISADLGL